MDLIVAQEVSKDYRVGEVVVPALRGVSFTIEPASFISFIGPSGSGKTTLLNLIGCLDAPTSGRLEVAGTEMGKLDRRQGALFRGANIGFIFQDFNLLPVLTVYENIEYPLLKDFGKLGAFGQKLEGLLSREQSQQKKPIFELHTWEKLSPFFNIARMIEIMTFFIKLMLIAIVLISITNVMIMAVYERIREIGTLSAIGTLPGKILSMFVIEGFCLGIAGALIGNIAGVILVFIINSLNITYDFGQQSGFVLKAALYPADILAVSATVIIVAVIASLQPAFKASRMEPIEALRHV